MEEEEGKGERVKEEGGGRVGGKLCLCTCDVVSTHDNTAAEITTNPKGGNLQLPLRHWRTAKVADDTAQTRGFHPFSDVRH